MRVAALLIGWFGAVLGLFVGLFVKGGFVGDSVLQLPGNLDRVFYLGTSSLSILGAVGGTVMWRWPRIGATFSAIAAVFGMFTSGALWLAPGSFFFVVSAIGFGLLRKSNDEKNSDDSPFAKKTY